MPSVSRTINAIPEKKDIDDRMVIEAPPALVIDSESEKLCSVLSHETEEKSRFFLNITAVIAVDTSIIA